MVKRKSGQYRIVILEDLRNTTKSSVRIICVPAKLRTDKIMVEASLFWDVTRRRLAVGYRRFGPIFTKAVPTYR
jgi:hypothetical protein